MSLLDRARVTRNWDPEAFRPFHVGGRRVGWVTLALARRLADFAEILVSGERLGLDPRIAGFEAMTRAMEAVHAGLIESGHARPPRNERYPVLRSWQEVPALAVDRALVPLFGLRSYGVHLNGYLWRDGRLHLWIGRRSPHKQTAPGKLDHLVAGGQPMGLTPMQNLLKECAEEASLPAEIARRARPVGLVTYLCRFTDGQRDDVLFCYDLEVPEDFTPTPGDDEVSEFLLLPVEAVRHRLAETEDFKFNVALVTIDFLIRRGLVGPEEPGYEEILHCLRSGGD